LQIEDELADRQSSLGSLPLFSVPSELVEDVSIAFRLL